MARVNLKGIARVKKKLADGSTREYHYAWRGGPLLADENGKPLLPDNPMYAVAYADAHRNRKGRPQGTLSKLVQMFLESSEFHGLSASSQREYRRYLDLLPATLLNMPLEAVQDPKARGDFKAWRDTMADKPRKADYAWTTIARVLSVAKDRGAISVNVCERGGRLYEADRAEKVWTPEQIRRFLTVASVPLQLAMLSALWTGQRQGDLLKLTWHQYDGKFLRLKQGKTGKRVRIPISGVLKSVLDEKKERDIAKGTEHILVNTRGASWTEDGFRTSWGKAYDKAGLPGGNDSLTFHDLRGTAVTRLALAGSSTSQIASFTGHSLKDVESLLDAHYLGGRFELAEQAMTLLENHQAALQISNTPQSGENHGTDTENG